MHKVVVSSYMNIFRLSLYIKCEYIPPYRSKLVTSVIRHSYSAKNGLLHSCCSFCKTVVEINRLSAVDFSVQIAFCGKGLGRDSWLFMFSFSLMVNFQPPKLMIFSLLPFCRTGFLCSSHIFKMSINKNFKCKRNEYRIHFLTTHYVREKVTRYFGRSYT